MHAQDAVVVQHGAGGQLPGAGSLPRPASTSSTGRWVFSYWRGNLVWWRGGTNVFRLVVCVATFKRSWAVAS